MLLFLRLLHNLYISGVLKKTYINLETYHQDCVICITNFIFCFRYGHGYEIFCVACNNSKTIIASACKVRKERF